MQQELPTKSLWYSRVMGEGEEEPYAPNEFGISGSQPHFFFKFNRQHEDCDSCTSMKMKLELPGTTTLRDALPRIAALLCLEPGCDFVPTLVEKPGGREIMVKEFETNEGLEDREKQQFRFLMALASLCDALFALYADVADAHVTALRTNMGSTLACLDLDKKYVMIDGKHTVYFVLM
jgi:hypothetical protein